MARIAKVYPLNMPPDLYDRAHAAAADQGETLASWIRQAIRERLERVNADR